MHYKREGRLSICGYSGYSSFNSSDVEEVTCQRCLMILGSKKETEKIKLKQTQNNINNCKNNI